jgi:HD-GYP domain-containing protein (c-di-GMP phosphodiesterase class II)
MLRVPIGYAQQGMVLAMPIFHPRRHDTMLLKAGMVLDDRTVARLVELKIKEFWIRYPGFDFLGEYVCPEIQEAQAGITRHIADAFDSVSQGTHARLDYAEYKNAIGGLLSRLIANPKASIFVQEMADRSEPALRHSSSVCMISVLMGLKLENYLIEQRVRMQAQGARDVASLGLGAMLHDIGMLRLAPETVDRWTRTQDESDPEFQQHVVLGFKQVREGVGPSAAAAVLHHHQKFDGSGFPRRVLLDGSTMPLQGRDIHIFARIIAAADLFDRLRYPPSLGPDKPALPVVRALRQMQTRPYADWVDPVVFRALLAVVPAYAPGTIVRLSNGEQAAIVETFGDDPCRPVVRTIKDPARSFADAASDGARYDLRACHDLSIAEAEGQDVSGDNFRLTPDMALEMDLLDRDAA